jgi:hypothetical protein
LSDKEFTIKFAAVIALSKVGDEDLISVFQKIATDDPWHLDDGMDRPTDRESVPGKKVLRYPLREIAQKEMSKRQK